MTDDGLDPRIQRAAAPATICPPRLSTRSVLLHPPAAAKTSFIQALSLHFAPLPPRAAPRPRPSATVGFNSMHEPQRESIGDGMRRQLGQRQPSRTPGAHARRRPTVAGASASHSSCSCSGAAGGHVRRAFCWLAGMGLAWHKWPCLRLERRPPAPTASNWRARGPI